MEEHYNVPYRNRKNRDSSDGIGADYGLDDRMIGVRIPVLDGNFSLRHPDQLGSGAHPAFYTRGTGSSFLGSKAAGV
jgi:hypothetical protein